MLGALEADAAAVAELSAGTDAGSAGAGSGAGGAATTRAGRGAALEGNVTDGLCPPRSNAPAPNPKANAKPTSETSNQRRVGRRSSALESCSDGVFVRALAR